MAEETLRAGQLIVIGGPMCGGKTPEFVQQIFKRRHQRRDLVIVTFAGSTRDYGEEGAIVSSQSGARILRSEVTHAFSETSLDEWWNKMVALYSHSLDHMASVLVGIEEAQFFPDLLCHVDRLVTLGALVVVAGLTTNANGEKWGQVLDLQSLSPEKWIQKNAICEHCHSVYGTMTARRLANAGESLSIVKVGGKEAYGALCRGCWAAREKYGFAGPKNLV